MKKDSISYSVSLCLTMCCLSILWAKDIWWYMLPVPTTLYSLKLNHPFNESSQKILQQVAIWLLRCFLEFCTALSTKTPVSSTPRFHRCKSDGCISPSANIYKTSKDLGHFWRLPVGHLKPSQGPLLARQCREDGSLGQFVWLERINTLNLAPGLRWNDMVMWVTKPNEQQSKTLMTFRYTDWLIGILILL